MRAIIALGFLALAACHDPNAASYGPPADAKAAEKAMRASYLAAIDRQSAADKADDRRTNATAAAISGQQVAFNVRQTAMMLESEDNDPTVGLRQNAKTTVDAIGECTWERMQLDQHAFDLYGIPAAWGYRCKLETHRTVQDPRTCRTKVRKQKEDGYFFTVGADFRFAPADESNPFGDNPWGTCKPR